MGLGAANRRVYDLLNDKSYLIHSNQRKYVWNSNNWQELFEDIDLVYKENRADHFIGSIVLKKENIKDGIRNHFSIIDGQQRISTLTIVYCTIGLLFVNNGNQEYFNGLNKQLFVYDNKNTRHTIVSKEANSTISKLVEALYDLGNNALTSKELLPLETLFNSFRCSKQIKECFEYFYREFESAVKGDMVALQKYKEIIDEIRYIDIFAEEDEDAFAIFETLNARGQPLTDYELLRNFLLKYSADKKEIIKSNLHELESLLSKESEQEIYLKHYVLHKYGEKTDKKENRPYKAITRHEKGNDISVFVEDLLLKAKYYYNIISFTNCSPLEYKIFSFFKPRRQQQFRPLVLGLMHQKDNGAITQETYDGFLEFLYEYFICYHIIGEQTSNKIEDIVYCYSAKIENSISDKLLNDFRKSMIDRMPSKGSFEQSIKRIRFSNHWKAYSGSQKRENVKAIFEVIERENGYNGGFDSFNIEHCYPDADNEENSQLGNLLLIEKSINDECQNKPLPEKIEYYRKSMLFEPRVLIMTYDRGEVLDINSRVKRIADVLYDYISNIKADETDNDN